MLLGPPAAGKSSIQRLPPEEVSFSRASGLALRVPKNGESNEHEMVTVVMQGFRGSITSVILFRTCTGLGIVIDCCQQEQK